MKLIVGTITISVIFLLIFGISSIFTSQFTFAQTIENEIMENTLNAVDKAIAGIPEIAPPVNDTSKSIETSTLNISEPISDNSSHPSEGTESTLAGVGDTTEDLTTNNSEISINNNSNLPANYIQQSLWKNYTDKYHGFTIEQPSSWTADNFSTIENSYQNATFEYNAYPATYDSYKVLTRISAIDKVVNYDSIYDDRIILEKPNMTKYIIDGERAGSYLFLQKDKDSFLQGNEIEEIITIHNGKEYHFIFEEKDFSFSSDFSKIKKHMINSIRWLD